MCLIKKVLTVNFYCFLILVILHKSSVYAQKPFYGSLSYSVQLEDTNFSKIGNPYTVNLFTNDTIVRVETNTPQFGKQIYIRHTALNKAYLLLEVNGTKYAIQTDLEQQKKKDTVRIKYLYKKTWKKKKFFGLKAKKVNVTAVASKFSYPCYFSRSLSNKYLEVYSDYPGLALDYFIPTEEGLLHYTLVDLKEQQLDRNLFGIPSDYKRVSFDDFLKNVTPK